MASVTLSAAELLLHRLQALDVACIFINLSTDYSPVIETWAKARAIGQKVLELVICPHEDAIISTVHGHYPGTGKVQVVMAYISAELTNAACGAINLVDSNIPVLIFSDRTPISEHSHSGCRSTPIGYGQKMRDQVVLIRELVKWDFELWLADQTGEHTDRVWAIASSLPKGSVYLNLPREPLCETFAIGEAALWIGPPQQPVRYAPIRRDIAQVAETIACARHPATFTQHGARAASSFARLNSLVCEQAIPLVEYWGTKVTLSTGNPLLVEADPNAWLADADMTLMVDSQALWTIAEDDCRQDYTVVQMGPDPFFSRYPVCGYHAGINLAGETNEVFNLLEEALHPLQAVRQQRVAEWVIYTQYRVQQQKNQHDALLHASQTGVITKPWLSYCLGYLANQHRGWIVSELTTLPQFAGLIHAESYYQEALVDGLGGALPIALGLQLACQEELIIIVAGDGSYLFANPAVYHRIAEVMKSSTLVVVGNNGGQGTIAGGTRTFYPDGYAARVETIPVTVFTTSPNFAAIAASSRVAALSVSRTEDLPGVSGGAVPLIRTHRQSVLVDVQLAR